MGADGVRNRYGGATSMTNKEYVLDALQSVGTTGARTLRQNAATMSGTEIIAQEVYVPAFDPTKDYSSWPVGSPVADPVYNASGDIIDPEPQVWTLLKPYNAAHYPGSRPANTRALWGLAHTTDPAKAKPFVQSEGTSGLYAKGECCTDPLSADPSQVYRSKKDGVHYRPGEWPDDWEAV